ncbi:hypothetical protein I4U23_001452 [Adineta vaga]|nr:hypothetical protein I4U23_001452 [Adineta vaga]
MKNSLKLEKVYQSLVNQSLEQRSQCNFFFPSINDTLLIFQFHLRHSSTHYQNQSDSNIQEQFREITHFPVDINDNSFEVYLCSIDGFQNTEITSTEVYFEPVSYTPAIRAVETSSRLPNICHLNFSDLENKWISIGNMSESLMNQRSIFIPEDNSILVMGGTQDEFLFSNKIQKYQLINQSLILNFSSSMNIKRNLYSADRLSLSGLILLIATSEEQSIAELFDPISSHTTSIEMLTNRRFYTSVVLPKEDRIILIGGNNYSSTVLSTGDVFNGTHFLPILNKMMVKRIYHTATYIPTMNKILITGGRDNENDGKNTYDTIEFYDITSNMFERIPNITMSIARARHTATYIPFPIDKVLIIGGETNDINYLDSCELFDIQTLSFTKQGTIAYGRSDHHAALLNNNNDILITDGISNSMSIISSEVFSLKTMSSCPTATMNTLRERFTSTLIPLTGEVLVCGGRDIFYNTLNSCELYIP